MEPERRSAAPIKRGLRGSELGRRSAKIILTFSAALESPVFSPTVFLVTSLPASKKLNAACNGTGETRPTRSGTEGGTPIAQKGSGASVPPEPRGAAARQKEDLITVGFEPTPSRTSALSWRLRPLGQVTIHDRWTSGSFASMKAPAPQRHPAVDPSPAPGWAPAPAPAPAPAADVGRTSGSVCRPAALPPHF